MTTPAAGGTEVQRDTVARARQDGRFGAPIAGSEGVNLNWSPTWKLRWVDFAFTNGRRFRIFHATA